MNYPTQYIRKGPRRSKAWMVALEYILWPGKRPHGLLKALAYENKLTPSRLSSLATEIRTAART